MAISSISQSTSSPTLPESPTTSPATSAGACNDSARWACGTGTYPRTTSCGRVQSPPPGRYLRGSRLCHACKKREAWTLVPGWRPSCRAAAITEARRWLPGYRRRRSRTSRLGWRGSGTCAVTSWAAWTLVTRSGLTWAFTLRIRCGVLLTTSSGWRRGWSRTGTASGPITGWDGRVRHSWAVTTRRRWWAG